MSCDPDPRRDCRAFFDSRMIKTGNRGYFLDFIIFSQSHSSFLLGRGQEDKGNTFSHVSQSSSFHSSFFKTVVPTVA